MSPHDLDIDRIKRLLIILGFVGLVSGAWMAFSFGASMSFAHAVTLALLSCVVAVMPTIIDHLRRLGRKPAAGALAVIAVLFTGVEYFSHLGYTIGHRVADTEQTGVQNTRYEDTREAVTDHKAKLAMWQDRLKTLTAQHAWAPTTKAEGLRAQLDSAQKAIDLETSRGGCKTKCLALMKDKAGLEERISIAEEADTLTKQINATQALIDKSREKAATTEFRSSPIVNQTKFVAQLWTTSLEPGSAPMNWTQIAIGAMIALVTTFLAPVCWFMAFGDAQYKQPTTGFTRGQAPDAETAARQPGNAMIIERTVDDTVFAQMVASATNRKLAA